MTALNISVAASSDDAEEFYSPAVPVLNSTDLDFFDSNDHWVGLRFLNLTIIPGSTIDTCIVRLISRYTSTGPLDGLVIACQDADDAATFTTDSGNLSSRSRTSESVPWTPGDTGAEDPIDTPDFAAALQEVIDRPGWASGQAAVIIFQGASPGNADLSSWAYDHGSDFPELRITYTLPVGGYALVF